MKYTLQYPDGRIESGKNAEYAMRAMIAGAVCTSEENEEPAKKDSGIQKKKEEFKKNMTLIQRTDLAMGRIKLKYSETLDDGSWYLQMVDDCEISVSTEGIKTRELAIRSKAKEILTGLSQEILESFHEFYPELNVKEEEVLDLISRLTFIVK